MLQLGSEMPKYGDGNEGSDGAEGELELGGCDDLVSRLVFSYRNCTKNAGGCIMVLRLGLKV